MAARLPNIPNVVALSRTIAVKQPFLLYDDFKAFVTANSLAVNNASIIMYGMMHSAIAEYRVTMQKGADPNNVGAPYFTTANAQGPVLQQLGQAWDPSINDPEYNHALFLLLNAEMGKATLHNLELCAAYQVGGLRDRNFESYFRMAKAEIPVNRIIQITEFIASQIPLVISDVNFQAHVQNVNWLKYHTSAASSQSLVQKWIDEMGAIVNIGAQTRAAVTAAIRAPWNKALIDAIPRVALQQTYCYLKAGKSLPDNWFQGEKAVSAMGTPDRARATAFYAKAIDLLTDITAVNNANNIQGLALLNQTNIP